MIKHFEHYRSKCFPSRIRKASQILHSRAVGNFSVHINNELIDELLWMDFDHQMKEIFNREREYFLLKCSHDVFALRWLKDCSSQHFDEFFSMFCFMLMGVHFFKFFRSDALFLVLSLDVCKFCGLLMMLMSASENLFSNSSLLT